MSNNIISNFMFISCTDININYYCCISNKTSSIATWTNLQLYNFAFWIPAHNILSKWLFAFSTYFYSNTMYCRILCSAYLYAVSFGIFKSSLGIDLLVSIHINSINSVCILTVKILSFRVYHQFKQKKKCLRWTHKITLNNGQIS